MNTSSPANAKHTNSQTNVLTVSATDSSASDTTVPSHQHLTQPHFTHPRRTEPRFRPPGLSPAGIICNPYWNDVKTGQFEGKKIPKYSKYCIIPPAPCMHAHSASIQSAAHPGCAGRGGGASWLRRCGSWLRRCGSWLRRCASWLHRGASWLRGMGWRILVAQGCILVAQGRILVAQGCIRRWGTISDLETYPCR